MPRMFAVVCVWTMLAVSAPLAAAAQDWTPVSQAELALARPAIEPRADAEVLVWDVTITDDVARGASRAWQHYLRIKIFNERGRDAASRVDLNYNEGEQIRKVRGRTTSPTGVVTELASGDVRQRTLVEVEGSKQNALTFVLPAVVPGSIVEYRWEQVREGPVTPILMLPFQRSMPVHDARYHIHPLPGYQMRTHVFNPSPTLAKKDEAGGYSTISAQQLPSMRPEPFMPPDRVLGTWMLIEYIRRGVDPPEEQFWSAFVKDETRAWADRLKSNDDIVRAAREATMSATTPPQKVEALIRYLRAHVRRLDVAPAGSRSDDGARETLKRGAGTSTQLVVLFTALARAAGMQAYLARMPDRESFVALPRLKLPYFLPKLATAIQSEGGWAIIDAGNEYSPGGVPRWQQEGTYALVLDGEKPNFLSIGVMPPEFSQARRDAAFKLRATGDLEGECTLTFTGHFASQYRSRIAAAEQADRQKVATAHILAFFPQATVDAFRIDNLDDAEKPLTMHFTLTYPAFARRTATRLEFTAATLPMEIAPQFAESTRTRPVVFPFAWSEEDLVTIELPDGYEVEGRTPPSTTTMKDGRAGHAIRVEVDGRKLTFRRSLSLTREGVATPVEDYAQVKSFFDAVRNSGRSGLLLRRKDDGSAQ